MNLDYCYVADGIQRASYMITALKRCQMKKMFKKLTFYKKEFSRHEGIIIYNYFLSMKMTEASYKHDFSLNNNHL